MPKGRACLPTIFIYRCENVGFREVNHSSFKWICWRNSGPAGRTASKMQNRRTPMKHGMVGWLGHVGWMVGPWVLEEGSRRGWFSFRKITGPWCGVTGSSCCWPHLGQSQFCWASRNEETSISLDMCSTENSKMWTGSQPFWSTAGGKKLFSLRCGQVW